MSEHPGEIWLVNMGRALACRAEESILDEWPASRHVSRRCQERILLKAVSCSAHHTSGFEHSLGIRDVLQIIAVIGSMACT